MATSDELLNKMNEAIAALQAAQKTVVDGAAQLGNAVHRTGDEDIAGKKDFTASPTVPTPEKGDNSTLAATTAFVNTALEALGETLVHLKGNETIEGTKTFKAPPVLPTPTNTNEGSMQAAPIAFIRDEYRREVERASGGRNTIIRDRNRNPHMMLVIPRFNLQDIHTDLGTGPHPAFIVGGVTKSELFVGKYLAGKGSDGLVTTLGGMAPWVRINMDQAIAACRALGPGFGCCTNAAYSARALWLWKEFGEHVYLGNTSWGRSHVKTHQVGVMQDTSFAPGDTGNNTTAGAATLTGTGPDDWNDDGTPWGLSDLVGNVWEWSPGLRFNEGEINIIPNNDAMLADADHSASSGLWKGILQNGNLVTPGTANTLKIEAPKTGDGSNTNVGAPTLATSIANKLSGSNAANCVFNTFKAASGVTVPAILKTLGIFPLVASDAGIQGYFWTRNFGERLALRGGGWHHGSHCGPFALNLSPTRTNGTWGVGFRSAFLA